MEVPHLPTLAIPTWMSQWWGYSTDSLLWYLGIIMQDANLHLSARGGWLCPLPSQPLQVPVLSRRRSRGNGGSCWQLWGRCCSCREGKAEDVCLHLSYWLPQRGSPWGSCLIHFRGTRAVSCSINCAIAVHLNTVSIHKLISTALCLWY